MLIAEFNHVKTKPLSDLLPFEIDGLSRRKAQELLGISQPTCHRYLTCLLQEMPKHFDFMPRNQYLSRGTLEALYQFQQLVEKFQYEGAVARIKKHMEAYYELQPSNQ